MCFITHPPVFLVEQLNSNEIRSRLGRSVEVTRITVGTLVQILLEGIEDVLYTPIDLQLQMLVQHESIVQLGIEIEEIGSVYHLILLDVSVRETSRDVIGRGKVWES